MSGDPSETDVARCANCGAPIQSLAADSLCPYCGAHVHQVTAEEQNQEAARLLIQAVSEAVHQRNDAVAGRSARAAPSGGPSPAAVSASARKGCSCVSSLFGLVVLAVAAAAVYSWFDKTAYSFEYWDTSAEVPASIAGHDAFLGLGRAYIGDKLYLAAIDADGASLLWKTGPLGTFSQGHQYTHFAVAGKQAAVSDYRGQLHVLELATGHTLRTLRLSDRADQLCPVGAGSSVWVEVINKQNVDVNLATGLVTRNAPRPPGCVDEHKLHHSADGAPKVDGFKVDHVLRSGTLAVAAGEKTPGTPVPVAVGFDPATGSVRWHATIPAVDTSSLHTAFYHLDKADVIAGDRYVVAYPTGEGNGMRLTAFDAMTGRRLWDEPMPSGHTDPSGLVATTNHILVGRWLALDVFRKSDGAHVGTVGKSR